MVSSESEYADVYFNKTYLQKVYVDCNYSVELGRALSKSICSDIDGVCRRTSSFNLEEYSAAINLNLSSYFFSNDIGQSLLCNYCRPFYWSLSNSNASSFLYANTSNEGANFGSN